jgi:hypothetical protein
MPIKSGKTGGRTPNIPISATVLPLILANEYSTMRPHDFYDSFVFFLDSQFELKTNPKNCDW